MVDIPALLNEVSPDSPCGENLEYDPQFGEMERAAVGKPEQQFGDTVVSAEEPKWKDVQKLALELLTRTKDLRIAAELARSELALSGFIEFLTSLDLICGYVERYWESVHPMLDPDDDNDPVLRVNTIESLCDEDKTLRPLRLSPIVTSRSVGRFSLRDVAVANGDMTLPEGSEAPDWTTINAAFEESSTEDIRANVERVRAAIENLTSMQRAFNEHVGAGRGINLSALTTLLKSAEQVYADQLTRRGVSAAGDATEEAGVEGESVNGEVRRLTGDVTTREDVLRCLDKIVEYYTRYEPSSPLPLLLQRCKKLVSASFLEIIQDLAPDVLGQISAMGGAPPPE
jgi:type VI secretion system protein ImpA